MAYSTSTDVYNLTGLTSSDVSTSTVDAFIMEADALIDAFAQTTFTTSSSTVELHDGGGAYFQVKCRPIIAVSEVAHKKDASTWVAYTADTDYFVYKEAGFIKLTGNTPSGSQNIRMTYTYGHASIPVIVKESSAILAGLKCFLRLPGNQGYISYNLGELTVNYSAEGKHAPQIAQLKWQLEERLPLIKRAIFYST